MGFGQKELSGPNQDVRHRLEVRGRPAPYSLQQPVARGLLDLTQRLRPVQGSQAERHVPQDLHQHPARAHHHHGAELGIPKPSRRELDEFSYTSHVRAARATQEGRFRRHLVPVEGQDPEGRPVRVEHDEGIRFEPSLERMLQLPPVFRPDGRVTAGNSSQISDGAAAVLVADREFARAHGLRVRARFRARVVVAGDPTLQLMEVVPATRAALQRAGLSLKDVDVVEINEAFASVVLGWARELEPDLERVNPNGGAIAHGHPLGATGAVLMAKLVDELERREGQFGLQVMCIGHGMATATVLERVS